MQIFYQKPIFECVPFFHQTLLLSFQVKGDWWVTRGLNCGQSDDYPGGYDGYPCQHERFIKQESGQWINRVTYCDGKNDECLASGIIETIANVSLPAPGVVQHDYTDAPLSPQVSLYR